MVKYLADNKDFQETLRVRWVGQSESVSPNEMKWMSNLNVFLYNMAGSIYASTSIFLFLMQTEAQVCTIMHAVGSAGAGTEAQGR